MLHGYKIFLFIAFNAVFYMPSVYADSKITSEYYNPFSGELEKEIVSITTGKLRVERPAVSPQRYQIVDLVENKTYLIDTSNHSVIVNDLNQPSRYKNNATLVKVGKGPDLLDEQETMHYLFKAGNITCSHIYIANIQHADVSEYLKRFSMVPIKVEGMMVQAEEKACQKAARDAAVKIKAIGVPLQIKHKDNHEVLYSINEVTVVNRFPASVFEVKNRQAAQSVEDIMKQGMEAALQESAYEKFLQGLEAEALPEEQKDKLRKDAAAALKKGTFIDHLMALDEKALQGKAASQEPKQAVSPVLSNTLQRLPVDQLAGYQVSSGSKLGADHAMYQMNYEAMQFGCDGKVTLGMSSAQHKFDTSMTGTYQVSDFEIGFHNGKENNASNYLVGLVDGYIVIGQSSFEGPQGLFVDSIKKVMDCQS